MKRAALLALVLCAAAAVAADDPAPADFAWRGTLETDGRSGLVRVPVPADALARQQSADGADLRVFDAQGRPVPFARSAPTLSAPPPRQETQPFAALPLYTAEAGSRTRPGEVRVRLDEDGQRRSVRVQLGAGSGEPPPAAQRLAAALFDTRALKDSLSGLVVQARLPANAPARFTLSTSPDLANWTPVPVQGRLYRFDGAGAPSNDRLEFPAPLQLQDRYLRLDWAGQAEIAVDAVVGLLARTQAEPVHPALALGEAHVDGATALEWQLGFATPLRKLHVATAQANTLVPLRILGRNQPSQPWRVLAHTVVYRLGAGADESANGPVELAGPSVRWLRVEATHGARLQGVPLTARVLFDPLELVFVAGASGPYQLVAGRTATAATALPLSMLSSTTNVRVQDLPAVRITQVRSEPVARAAWAEWLPRSVDTRTAGLWAILGVGVAVLAAVAGSLLRQVNASSPDV